MISEIEQRYARYLSNPLILCPTTDEHFFSTAITIENEKNDVSNLYAIPGRMLCSEGKVEVEVSKRSSDFLEPRKKVGRKVAHFYCRKFYRDWPQIQIPRSSLYEIL